MNGSILAAISGAPAGFPPMVNDTTNRVYRGLNPFTAPPDRVEPVNFAQPGTYLAVCTFQPQFNDGMFEYVTVLS